MTTGMKTLRERVRDFLVHGGSFTPLALDLYRWQRQHNPAYDRFCGDVDVTDWVDIPAVPVGVFRDVAMTCFPEDEATVTFLTSGTTGRRGRHLLRNTAMYDLGARRHAESLLGPLPGAGLSLVSHASESSLGHMCQAFVPGLPTFFGADGLDREGAWAALRVIDKPVFVPGTAFALAELVEGVQAPCALPEGSIVMVTGGFKGRRVTVGAVDLLHRLRVLFPGTRVVGEYGMTELSSQLWALPAGGPFVPPPWMRVCAVDPWTGAPAEQGVLRFVDLANHETVLAIETEDVGQVDEQGRVTLLGRLEDAVPRGCSLTVEEARLGLASESVEPGAGARQASAFGVDAPDQTLQVGDEARIGKVLAGLAALRAQDARAMAQGLGEANARACLDRAISAVTADGLRRELCTPGRRPETVAIVCAHGVFTSPIEWVALWVAAGAKVHLKAPSEDPLLCHGLTTALAAQGLPVTCSVARDLGVVDAVIAFGEDATVQEVASANPDARHGLYGHRFSVAVSMGDPVTDAEAISRDLAMYDSRGCMAPVAIFAAGDPVALGDALAAAMAARQVEMPVGPFAQGLGGEWRRRRALALMEGGCQAGEGWSVMRLPSRHFMPVALPRVAVIHPVSGPGEVMAVLSEWGHSLSTLGLSAGVDGAAWGPVQDLFHRLCPLGRMQQPAFPRAHDGRAMLGSLLDGGSLLD